MSQGWQKRIHHTRQTEKSYRDTEYNRTTIDSPNGDSIIAPPWTPQYNSAVMYGGFRVSSWCQQLHACSWLFFQCGCTARGRADLLGRSAKKILSVLHLSERLASLSVIGCLIECHWHPNYITEHSIVSRGLRSRDGFPMMPKETPDFRMWEFSGRQFGKHDLIIPTAPRRT